MTNVNNIHLRREICSSQFKIRSTFGAWSALRHTMILYVDNSTYGFISRSTSRLRVPSTRATPNTVINNYIWGESAEVEVIITPETINNYRIGQLDAGWGWMGRTMRKGRALRAIEMRGRVSRNSPRVWSLSRARSPRQETLFLADWARLRAACLSCPLDSLSRGSFFSSFVLYFSHPSSCSIRRSRPWRSNRYCPCFQILLYAFATRPLSPSRFLPRISFLTRYSPDRERKSSELNEYRVPLEGSLSMPTRETPVLAS